MLRLDRIRLLVSMPLLVAASTWTGPSFSQQPLQKESRVSNPEERDSAVVDHEQEISQIMKLLEKMPDWPILPMISDFYRDTLVSEKKLSLEKTARKIAQYNVDSVREAMKRYWNSRTAGSSIRINGKLFILNRFLFDLPQTVRRDSEHFRHFLVGWRGMPRTGDPRHPKPSDEISVRWPWKEGTVDGTLNSIGECLSTWVRHISRWKGSTIFGSTSALEWATWDEKRIRRKTKRIRWKRIGCQDE